MTIATTGTLTGVRSVTFSPPGLGLSYRKYKYTLASDTGASGTIASSSSSGAVSGSRTANTDSARDNKNNYVLSADSGSVHHKSIAVVTEFDWYVDVAAAADDDDNDDDELQF